ncbi:MAG TPA: sugar ABC transporter ATP-binding protein [Gaiellaceae bacterium]|nr:sugar ABC transporter ATP-binding protein [Gaiellaceae bacterium]
MPDAAPERPNVVELQGVSKHFGGVLALDAVSLVVERGTVHALIGENGAGKSTLGKIVAGVHAADSGHMLIDGEPVSFRSPKEALDHGVAVIAQEPSVVPMLTVAENVLLGSEPRGGGFVRRRALNRRYEQLAEEAGFHLRGATPAGRLRTAEQQQVEILRALARDARVVVMDEPSAALSGPDTARLHEIVRALAAAGKTIILISHFLREVLELSNTVTVLRDGRVVETTPTATATEQSLVEAMLGRPLTAAFPSKSLPPEDAPVVLSARGIVARGVVDVSLEVRSGEIVGLAGLVGAGRTELARAIFGADALRAGEVVLGDSDSLRGGPRQSLSSGLAMIPESRKDAGLIFTRSVRENVTLARLRSLSRMSIVRRGAERQAATSILDRCDVRGAHPSARVGALSGGNQQKVLFARMLLCEPRLLIADEPTRGVDVGAKRAIYDILVSLAESGMGILLISSELEEILGLAHRVAVMRRGRIVAELSGDEMTEAAILAAAFSEPAGVEAA